MRQFLSATAINLGLIFFVIGHTSHNIWLVTLGLLSFGFGLDDFVEQKIKEVK